MTTYYFGCWNTPGHHLHTPNGTTTKQAGPYTPQTIDTKYPPQNTNQNEHQTTLTHTQNWTILAMWDRTIDTRQNSNAAFLTQGTHTTEQMWQNAHTNYPQITKRLKAAQSYLGNTKQPS